MTRESLYHLHDESRINEEWMSGYRCGINNTCESLVEDIRKEIKKMTSNRGFLSCEVDFIHERIDEVFDKYLNKGDNK